MLTVSSLGFSGASAADPSADSQRQISLEALSRLKGMDLEANPALKAVLLKTLDQVRGTPDYVALVRDFQLPGHERELLDVALRNPGSDTASDALQLLLQRDFLPILTNALISTNASAVLQTIGTSADRRIVGLVADMVNDPARGPTLRRQAVRALGNSTAGTDALLQLLREGKVADELKLTARLALQGALGPSVQEELALLLPPLKGVGAESLPPISELTKRTGSVARGAEVFKRDTVGCNQCHQVNGQGTDFGPALSEIGTKLGKDALYEAILDPSAGISFGYEGWELELKNGDEISGLLVSETESEVAVKVRGGAVTRYAKTDLASRRKSALSVMPAGLQQMMSTQDLLDLVEYLTSLKKAQPQ
jgi:putative heme-binding domain-containing protein